MNITALHRAAGEGPGPITDELLDAAIAAGTTETDDLDWKQALPQDRDLKDSDFPKDVAAMANNRGGVIVYGVTGAQNSRRSVQVCRRVASSTTGARWFWTEPGVLVGPAQGVM